MKLTDEDRKKMAQILDDMSAISQLSQPNEMLGFYNKVHTLEMNKTTARALVYLARKGLENDVPTVD